MIRKIYISLLMLATLSSCINNDLPKPVVDLYIASLDVEGTDGDITLDRLNYTATIPLAEETNIEAVQFNSITFGAQVITNINFEADESKIVVSKDLNNRVINMSQPEYITLSYFQSYEWKIVATQTINRIWTVDGQIGATEWDVEGHRAIVKRREDYPLNDVKTLDVRFGPRPTYDYPSVNEIPTDFDNATKSQTISVTAHDKNTLWELVIVPSEVALDFEYVAAGANVIWIKAANIDGASIEFAYRKRGSEEWLKVENGWYASDSKNPYNRYEEGFVKAVIRGLEPGAEYEVIGYADDKQSDVRVVTTASLYQMPNSNMEEWGKFTNDQSLLPTGEAGPCWYPFSSVLDMFWATGNPGGTSLGEKYNLTYPVYKSANATNVPADSTGEVSAFMGSQNVLGMKFAAGNLFVGHYGETIGTNATVFFGRPMAQNVKPVAVRFKTKYWRGNINYVDSKAASVGVEYHIGDKQIKVMGGQPDLAKVFFCLADWSEPHCVNSKDEATFFDPRTASGILGLGYFDSDSNPEMVVESTDRWHTMTLPIEYSNPEVVPSQLLLTFTCSGYGDYFTGSSDSWMYIDDIELLYDLDENNLPK
ncbi:MAG: PCMD domain-containing protein [Alistipes sp.]|nr:PCMD domain-containing protein [Alistipes sp.]